MKCAVANCKSDNNRQACDISFFLFPMDANLAKKWKQFCRRGDALNTKSSYVCMKHFTSEDIENNRQFEMGFAKKRLLKRGVVPTIYEENLWNFQRAERAQHRENKRIVSELLQQSENAATTEGFATKLKLNRGAVPTIREKSDETINGKEYRKQNERMEIDDPLSERHSSPKLATENISETYESCFNSFAYNFKLNRGVVPTVGVKPDVTTYGGTHCEQNENMEVVDPLAEDHTSPKVVNKNISETYESFSVVAKRATTVDNEIRESPPLLPAFSYALIDTEDVEVLKTQNKTLRHKNAYLHRMQKKLSSELNDTTRKLEEIQRRYTDNFYKLRKSFEEKAQQCKNLEDILEGIFTKRQIHKMKSGDKNTTWEETDIAHSITLFATSAKAYKLLYRKEFPLPAVRILQRWSKGIDFSTGFLQPVSKVMAASTQMNEMQKLCVLSFGEMDIRKSYCYDWSTDTTLGPVDYVQVAMLRGFLSCWTQPVFYEYDSKMTPVKLNDILIETKRCGYTVVAVVCDLEGNNRALFTGLYVTQDKPWFIFDKTKIFVFADVPHLIRSIRNNFVDYGFWLNGKKVNKDIILELLNCDSTDLSVKRKISAGHLDITSTQRQKLKFATELFSNTVAQAIKKAANKGHLSEKNWKECYQLFKLTNGWFDIMNVKKATTNSTERCIAYGLSLNNQNKILDEMTEMMAKMRVIGSKALLPFQRGIIQSNTALKMLFPYLQKRFKAKFVLTYHLNQNILQHFFEITRAKVSPHDYPDRQEFKHNLKSYILECDGGAKSNTTNVGSNNTPDLENLQPSLTALIFKHLRITPEADQTLAEMAEWEGMTDGGLENLSTYICHKLTDDNNTVHLSEEGLSNELKIQMKSLLNKFDEINGNGLLITKNYLQKHLEQTSNIDCNYKVKELFFRSRMFLKIRKLNKEMEENNHRISQNFKEIFT